METCRFIAQINEMRIKADHRLKGRYFCLEKIKINIGKDLEKEYDLILCDSLPKQMKKCKFYQDDI